MSDTTFDYAVVGAGPAGIAAVGVLLDQGKKVLWIDPNFTCGRLNRYRNIPSNTKVKYFTEFLNSCESFKGYDSGMSQNPLLALDPEETCLLGLVVDQLQRLTEHLHGKTYSVYGTVYGQDITYCGSYWSMYTDPGSNVFMARDLVFCQGAEPREIKCKEEILFDTAIDESRLEGACRLAGYLDTDASCRFVVHGDSHSAMLILMNLYCLGIPTSRILNLYKRPDFRFAEEREDGTIRFDNTGLKGKVADWVKKVYLPSSPNRLFCEDYIKVLDRTDVHIGATGFEPNDVEFCAKTYDRIYIGRFPKPYYFGIMEPERINTEDGETEENVGMIKFMRHIKKTFTESK